jgi:predicted TIM-barrel fold metal-dependent hydrolase
MRNIIDMHTHFSIETGAVSEDAGRIGFTVENKSLGEHLNMMDRLGITHAVLSCPTLKYLDDPAACVKYCRQVNDAGASIIHSYPDRFSFAAILPLPYVSAAVEEAERALSELGACAVGMCSNYSGMYLGDERLAPLFALLNDKCCSILLHPAAPPVWPEGPITGKILPMFEFITDTTRSVLDLIDSGMLSSHPNVKLVIPHTGSCLPVALDRYYGIMRAQGRMREAPLEQLYYDLACDAYPHAVPILLTWTDTSHIVYGTDFPAIPLPVLEKHLSQTLVHPAFVNCLDDVLWNNARRLLINQ